MNINLNRHIYEGWRVKDFINDLDPSIPELVEYFSEKYKITKP